MSDNISAHDISKVLFLKVASQEFQCLLCNDLEICKQVRSPRGYENLKKHCTLNLGLPNIIKGRQSLKLICKTIIRWITR